MPVEYRVFRNPLLMENSGCPLVGHQVVRDPLLLNISSCPPVQDTDNTGGALSFLGPITHGKTLVVHWYGISTTPVGHQVFRDPLLMENSGCPLVGHQVVRDPLLLKISGCPPVWDTDNTGGASGFTEPIAHGDNPDVHQSRTLMMLVGYWV